MGRGFWQPKRPPAGTRLFCLRDSPIWGMIAFRSLAGWRELRLPRQEDALEADGTFGWPCSSILFFQRPSVPTDNPERVPLPPPRYLSLQGMWMRRFIHSPCHLLASFSPLSATHPLPVVPPLPLSIRPRTSRRAQPALLRACAGSYALFPNTVRGGKLFALQAFILHFIPASIPAFASLRLFPWISGALVDRNVDLCGKRRAGGRALSMICESCELCSLGETRGKLMEQREQAMWTTVRPTDPPAVLLWAVGGGAERSGTCLPFGILC